MVTGLDPPCSSFLPGHTRRSVSGAGPLACTPHGTWKDAAAALPSDPLTRLSIRTIWVCSFVVCPQHRKPFQDTFTFPGFHVTRRLSISGSSAPWPLVCPGTLSKGRLFCVAVEPGLQRLLENPAAARLLHVRLDDGIRSSWYIIRLVSFRLRLRGGL